MGGGCVQIQCSEAIEAIKLLRGPPRRGVADLEAAVAGRPAPPAGNADERRQLLEAQALLDAQKVTRPRCLRARPPPPLPRKKRTMNVPPHVQSGHPAAHRAAGARAPPPPLPRTNRTSLVPPLVLSGHAASLSAACARGGGAVRFRETRLLWWSARAVSVPPGGAGAGR